MRNRYPYIACLAPRRGEGGDLRCLLQHGSKGPDIGGALTRNRSTALLLFPFVIWPEMHLCREVSASLRTLEDQHFTSLQQGQLLCRVDPESLYT